MKRFRKRASGAKFDSPGAQENLAVIQKKFPEFEVLAISAEKRINLKQLEEAIRKLTGLIRIYTKDPLQKSVDSRPTVLPNCSTVEDLARKIHKELATKVKSAKIWGASAKFPGQEVGRRHILVDEDVVTMLC